MNRSEKIAVIGIACKFPGASNYEAFWYNLVHGINVISEIPKNRWSIQNYYKNGEVDQNENKACSKWAGLIEQIEHFDAEFFQISPREAENMDPQQRLLLQETWHCIEDAGIPLAMLQKNKTAVFAGVMAVDYQHYVTNTDYLIDAYSCLGNYAGIIANRVSHCFKFSGESKSIDTACSSSLVALHDAHRSILSAESGYAVVAGVNIICHPWKYISFAKSHMLSPEGQCKTFDITANGYVPGEGIGVLLLCSLARAEAMGHTIYGVLESCVVNHNAGRSNITAPNKYTQIKLIQTALQKAKLLPKDIAYVETHGTGTILGDPIEIAALHRVMKNNDPSCLVGSVKTNIGHLEAAAGIAGVIKVLLMLKHQHFVPTINFQQENPLINFDKLSVKPVLQNQSWTSSRGLRIAGVSSFGFGGVNAHCILSEYMAKASTIKPVKHLPTYPFLLSAKSADSLFNYAKSLLHYVDHANVIFHELCLALLNKEQFDYRFSAMVKNLDELKIWLRDFLSGHSPQKMQIDVKKSTVFTFTDLTPLGPKYLSDLCEHFPFLSVLQGNELHATRKVEENPAIPLMIASYRYAKFLVCAGINPDYLMVTRGSVLTACLLAGMITIGQAIQLINHQKVSIDINIPEIPLVLAENNKMYEILNIEILGDLIEKIYIEGPLGSQLLILARRLLENQFTFNRYINEYAQTTNAYGIDIVSVIKNENVREQSTEHQLITLLVIAAALYKLNKKWQLNDQIKYGSLAFKCLRQAIAEDIVPIQLVLATVFKIQLSKDYLDDVSMMNNGLYRKQSFPLIKEIYKLVHIQYQITSLDELYNHVIMKAIIPALHCKSAIVINDQAIKYENALQNLINAWQHGHTIYWHKIFQQKLFKPVQLPGYVFDTQPLWLQRKKTVTNQMEQEHKHKIAIIGFSGRFPGAEDGETFWRNLINGEVAITEVPENRWNISKFYDPDKNMPNKSYAKWGGFLSNVDAFDANFFNILPNDALLMDPQQRLVLEEVYKALEVSGYTGNRLNKDKCGIYVGVMNNDYYEKILSAETRTISASEYIGNHNSILAGRVAYFFNLNGPAIAIDTACSSSSVAIHLACDTINSGAADMMIAGGVTLYLSETPYISMCKANMLSPEGLCKTFDDKANGFVPAEGVGFVILKKLQQAVKDGDHIYAVIEGSGINQDGRSNGITAPNLEAQKNLLIDIYKKNNVDPEKISYIEAHGTGTKLGDPVEVAALTKAFSEFTAKKQYCAIGSVKSNIGHTSAASGVISVIKLLLCLQHKKLVPTVNYQIENEHIRFAETPFYVNKTYQAWETKENTKRMAGVSSFGFSGTNCHLILSEYNSPIDEQHSHPSQNIYPIPITAHYENGIHVYITKLYHWLNNNRFVNLANVSYTLCYGRAHFKHRILLWVTSIESLLAILSFMLKDTMNITQRQINVSDELWDLSLSFQNQKKIDWTLFLQNHKASRIIYLPSYCFNKKNYYFVDNHLANKRNEIEPLADIRNRKAVIDLIIKSDDMLLTNHIINHQKILPAACIIEMMFAQIAKAMDVDYPLNLVDLALFQPIVSDGNDIALQMIVSQLSRNVATSTLYIRKGIEWVKAASASIKLEQKQALKKFKMDTKLAELRTIISQQKLYEKLNRLGLYYGEPFRLVRELRTNGYELIGKIAAFLKSYDIKYNILPTVLDAAFHSVISLGEYTTTYVPYQIKSLIMYALPNYHDDIYIYAKILEITNYTKAFNIYILDTHGSCVVEITGLRLHVSSNQSKHCRVPENTFGIYQTKWLAKQVSNAAINKTNSNSIRQTIIFQINEIEIDWPQHLLVITNGKDYYHDGNKCIIDFDCEEHYQKLVELFVTHLQGPLDIIMLWCADNQNKKTHWDTETINRYLLYPIYLSKALIKKRNIFHQVHLYLTLYGRLSSELLLFESLSASAKTINLETKKIKSKLLHLYFTNSHIKVSAGAILKAVASETRTSATHVLYRDTERFIKSYQKMSDSIVNRPGISLLRPGGVYVISGGAGGIGILLANYLIKQFNAKIVLLGRSVLNDKKQKMIDAICCDTKNIIYFTADIAIEKECNEVISNIKTQIGRINGIIHCAGVLKDNFLQNKTKDEINQVTSAKILSLMNIDEATKQDNLDLFVLFSSLAGSFGNIGQYDYAYANEFLNNYAKYRNMLVNGGSRFGKTISIGWPYWEIGGMELNQQAKQWLHEQFGVTSISGEEGLSAFEYMIYHLKDDCLILKGNRAMIEKKLFEEDML